MGIDKAISDILKGSGTAIAEMLPALSSDELAALLQAEQNGKRPRVGVLSAIEAEQLSRCGGPEGAEEDAPEAAAAPITVTNASKNRHRVNHIELAPGDSHTLTADDMKDERLMAKVNRALEISVLTHGAD